MVMDIRLWDKGEERYLEWMERAFFFVNCSTNRIYKFNRTGEGRPLINVSDRYEIRITERSK